MAEFALASVPFAHLRAETALPPELAARLLLNARDATDWHRDAQAFYAIELLRTMHATFDAELRDALATLFLAFHGATERAFGLELDRAAEVQVLRFGAGAAVGLHSDETECDWRLVVPLGYEPESGTGGHLLLADPRTKRSLTIASSHNTGVAFPTAGTLHGVTEHQGAFRFFLVASFLRRGRRAES